MGLVVWWWVGWGCGVGGGFVVVWVRLCAFGGFCWVCGGGCVGVVVGGGFGGFVFGCVGVGLFDCLYLRVVQC
ncbi:hypothetical protein, partial [Pseudomonas syringae group genomosp. 7]|uniref:hypothetical protein n=1 Tax=Pseudomonas syringae group genomosp. 7 TaxID=251699 RepID=UPI00376FAAE8